MGEPLFYCSRSRSFSILIFLRFSNAFVGCVPRICCFDFIIEPQRLELRIDVDTFVRRGKLTSVYFSSRLPKRLVSLLYTLTCLLSDTLRLYFDVWNPEVWWATFLNKRGMSESATGLYFRLIISWRIWPSLFSSRRPSANFRNSLVRLCSVACLIRMSASRFLFLWISLWESTCLCFTCSSRSL